MWRRKLLQVGALLLGYVVVCCAAGVFVAEATLHPGRRALVAADEEQARKMAQRQDSVITDVAIAAGDGTRLVGWELRPRRRNDNVVILLHGLSDNRMGMIGYAEMLLHRGFSVLMPDSRAHGSSGGAVATYGLQEGDDIHRWFEWALEHEHPTCIFGFGESMGAAHLLQSLQPEPGFCAVAAESPFSSLREMLMTGSDNSSTRDLGWGDPYCGRWSRLYLRMPSGSTS